MCDPTPLETETREIAIPYDTYREYCNELQALHTLNSHNINKYHQNYLINLFETTSVFDENDYNGIVYTKSRDLVPNRIHGLDSYSYLFNPVTIPQGFDGDTWILITISKCKMQMPWTYEIFQECFTLSYRFALCKI